MLNGEARRSALILHQTPGWRWRRELCLTERSQQRQSGATTKAWRRLPARQRQTRVRHRQSTCEKQCQNWRETLAGEATLDACEALSGHVQRALPVLHGEAGSSCGWHCPARAGGTARRVRVAPPERDPRGSGQHCFKELGRQRSCSAKRHAGSTAWRCADGSVRASAVAPPGSIVWTSAGSTARKQHLDECG